MSELALAAEIGIALGIAFAALLASYLVFRLLLGIDMFAVRPCWPDDPNCHLTLPLCSGDCQFKRGLPRW